MAESIPRFVLDSFALLAYFEAEPGGLAIRQLLESARDQKAQIAFSLINAGEVYYITYREQGAVRGEGILKDMLALPVQLYDAPERRILSAARIKAEHSLSYADAFTVALAQELDAILVTGDPEFRAVEKIVKVMWLESITG